MVFEKITTQDGWFVPINKDGEIDWVCPRCGHKHTSCCGNSHFPCTNGPNYGGTCECKYLDSLYPTLSWMSSRDNTIIGEFDITHLM